MQIELKAQQRNKCDSLKNLSSVREVLRETKLITNQEKSWQWTIDYWNRFDMEVSNSKQMPRKKVK